MLLSLSLWISSKRFYCAVNSTCASLTGWSKTVIQQRIGPTSCGIYDCVLDSSFSPHLHLFGCIYFRQMTQAVSINWDSKLLKTCRETNLSFHIERSGKIETGLISSNILLEFLGPSTTLAQDDCQHVNSTIYLRSTQRFGVILPRGRLPEFRIH